jgi:hypothetical protein
MQRAEKNFHLCNVRVWAAIVLLFAACQFCAQTLSAQEIWAANNGHARQIAPYFQASPAKTDPKLPCSVFHFPTHLSFGFQYWSGFDVNIQSRDFVNSAKDIPLTVAAEITNQRGEKYYYYQRTSLPQGIPEEAWRSKSVTLNFGGSYLVGVGKYSAKLLVVDGDGRSCWKQWRFEAPKVKAPVPTPPGEVRSNVMIWDGLKAVENGERVTVFLHAAPFYSRRSPTRLRPWDKSVLLGSLTALLKQAPYSNVRIVAFNLDARKVIYQSETFERRDFFALARALDNLDLGTVSVRTLQQDSEASFLASLMKTEASVPFESQRSQSAIIIGPNWRWGQKPDPAMVELRNSFKDIHYLAFQSAYRDATDSLMYLVKAGRGKVIGIFTPLDLAKAIETITGNVRSEK